MLGKKRVPGLIIAKYNDLYLKEHGVNPPSLSKGAKLIKSQLADWSKKDQVWFKCLLAFSVVLVIRDKPEYFTITEKERANEELKVTYVSYLKDPGDSTITNPSLRSRIMSEYQKKINGVRLDPVRISDELGVNVNAVRSVVYYLNKEG